MKTILAIWHVADMGKTETLREFANLLLRRPAFKPIYPVPAAVPATGDFRLVLEINGHIVAVESGGDPFTDLEQRLIDLADNFHAEVILCATRTKGYTTVGAVDHVAATKGFETIYTSTYQIGNPALHRTVNQSKARHLLNLLQRLGRI